MILKIIISIWIAKYGPPFARYLLYKLCVAIQWIMDKMELRYTLSLNMMNDFHIYKWNGGAYRTVKRLIPEWVFIRQFKNIFIQS
jgi:hypothetical protein